MSIQRWLFISLILTLVLSGCDAGRPPATSEARAGATSAPTSTPTPIPPTSTPMPARSTPAAQTRAAERVQRDVTYCTADGVELKMDLYAPAQAARQPVPVVVYVHGGGWTGGDKGNGAGTPEIREMVKRGYLAVSVNYRLAPQCKFPAQIEDVKCAIRYLRANAGRYNLDPNRIGAMGSSAGGHLAALLGVADASAQLEGNGGYADQSSRVSAVVDMFGPADLTSGWGTAMLPRAKEILGASAPDDPALARASPVTYITKDDPPFLILHGDQDKVVPLKQSEILNERLKAAGVASQLVVVKNAGHGFAPDGGAISPTRAELTALVAGFFDQQLKPVSAVAPSQPAITPRSQTPPPVNVILIGWDGAQREHVQQALARGELPNLKQLSSEGALADIDIIHTTDTKAGWSQILTGYNPDITGVYGNNRYQPIPPGYTAFERLEIAFGSDRFVTVAVIGKKDNVGAGGPGLQRVKPGAKVPKGTPVIMHKGQQYIEVPGKPFYNAQKSMDVFINGLAEDKNVGAKAIELLEQYKDRPFFFFVHLAEVDHSGHKYGENSQEYDDALISADMWTGKIVEKLKQLNLYGKTLIYVTADHGFNEGQTRHSNAPYVFLATNDPKMQGPGKRMDIAPTILARFGLDLSQLTPPLSGRSLLQP